MKPLDIIEKYYPESSDAYQILVTHSRSVADKASALARLHPEINLDLTLIGEAAMLYDIGIFLCDAPDIDCHGETDYICHGHLGADLMRKKGYPHHALIRERHMGTGLSLAMIEERNLPVPYRDIRPVSLREQLICSADRSFNKTKLAKEKPADKIKQNLSEYGNETVRQFKR